MPQLVKKRRSGWAVLAAGALVASILAVGASPAAAAQAEADAQATWTACVGPARADQGFDDVSMTGTASHYANINCLIYYGITSGKTADTYDPGAHVTRSQMALFLVQMANLAGVDLGDVMDAGFTDLGSTGKNRVDAINRLAAKGIMAGRSPGMFEPTDYVTRGDMAQHLFVFADLALDSVHIDNLPSTVDGDTTGIELNVANGDGTPVDDWFGDARRTQPAHVDEIIGAVYELGITAGTNGLVGEQGTFEPDALVTRAQMATFIMNTLNHTNLRPAGVTAQQTRTETQVSVRDADFKPMAGANVEFITTDFADDVFDSRGECVDRYVSNVGNGFEVGWDACRIDAGEQQTDDNGNHIFPTGTAGSPTTVCGYTLKASAAGDPDAKYGAWVWTGDYGDIVNRDTDLVEPGSANSQTGLRTPASAVFSGGTSYDAKMGRDTLTYTIQLLDRNGNPVGPEPDVNRTFSVTTYVIDVDDDTDDDSSNGYTRSTGPVDISTGQLSPTAHKETETMTPDSNGRIVIPVSRPDPNGSADHPNDVLVVLTVALGTGAETGLSIADAARPLTGNTVGTVVVNDSGSAPTGAWAAVVFSDNPSAPTSYTVSTRNWGRHNSTGNRNEATFTLLDQYGRSLSSVGNTSYQFTVTPTAVPVTTPATPAAVVGRVGSDGKARVVYLTAASVRAENFTSEPAVTVQSITAGVSPNPTITVTAPSTPPNLYWAEPGLSGTLTNQGVLVADPRARSMVVGAAADPEYYVFGTDDSFFVNSTALTFEQFMEVLTAASDPSNARSITIAGATLSVSGHDVNRPRDRAEWTLTLTCP